MKLIRIEEEFKKNSFYIGANNKISYKEEKGGWLPVVKAKVDQD